MARCAITGGDGGDLIGSELTIVTDTHYGVAFVFEEQDAHRLVALANGTGQGCIEFHGEDGGDLIGEHLHELVLDGKLIGWAQAGWLAMK